MRNGRMIGSRNDNFRLAASVAVQAAFAEVQYPTERVTIGESVRPCSKPILEKQVSGQTQSFRFDEALYYSD